ncbi:DUF599 domain-containing protein [Kordiimonas pumila]|uniref:DUF599 domain-containing protein n=1 Tax=Kordiimonas pumila TaxID=2161677 RepID=A0ABV7D3L2_9PROT|nr:DUF599 domain-containing protein [Kordiimonas pumila]
MIEKLVIFGVSMADVLVVSFFLLVWIGYTYVADHSSLHKKSISYAMDRQRLRWLTEASSREVKIVDTNVLRTLITGISFFASSTVLVMGGLIAALGYAEKLAVTFSHLPLINPVTTDGLTLRFCFLLGIFVYAFFKFAWAFRTANYCAIIIGGMPDTAPNQNAAAKQNRITVATSLSSTSGHSYNRGIRAYFFALAGLAWFVGPVFFVAATIVVLLVLIRREFASNSVRMLRGLD